MRNWIREHELEGLVIKYSTVSTKNPRVMRWEARETVNILEAVPLKLWN